MRPRSYWNTCVYEFLGRCKGAVGHSSSNGWMSNNFSLWDIWLNSVEFVGFSFGEFEKIGPSVTPNNSDARNSIETLIHSKNTPWFPSADMSETNVDNLLIFFPSFLKPIIKSGLNVLQVLAELFIVEWFTKRASHNKVWWNLYSRFKAPIRIYQHHSFWERCIMSVASKRNDLVTAFERAIAASLT